MAVGRSGDSKTLRTTQKCSHRNGRANGKAHHKGVSRPPNSAPQHPHPRQDHHHAYWLSKRQRHRIHNRQPDQRHRDIDRSIGGIDPACCRSSRLDTATSRGRAHRTAPASKGDHLLPLTWHQQGCVRCSRNTRWWGRQGWTRGTRCLDRSTIDRDPLAAFSPPVLSKGIRATGRHRPDRNAYETPTMNRQIS